MSYKQFGIRHKPSGQYICGAKGQSKHLSNQTKNIVLYGSSGKAQGALKTGGFSYEARYYEIVEFTLQEVAVQDMADIIDAHKAAKQRESDDRKQKELERKEALEKAEFERLQKKYG